MRYFLSKGKTAIIAAACIFNFMSCTSVELDFSNEFIPDIDDKDIKQVTLTGLKAYNISRDSVRTSLTGSGYVGSMVTPLFGGVDMSFVTTYLPGMFDSDSLWGENPKIDSVFFVYESAATYGDSTSSSTRIAVTALQESLPYSKASDSVYYSNFNIKPYLASKPFVEFDLNGSEDSKRIALPNEIGEQFLDTTGQIYFNDSLFIKKFPGWYFSSTPAQTRGAIHKANLANTFLEIYYTSGDDASRDSTGYVEFWMSYSATNFNQIFTLIDHNYDLADPIIGIDPTTIGDTINPQEKVYIQAFGSVMGKLDFSKEGIQNIIDDAKARGYNHIAVNNAKVNFNVYNPSSLNLDDAFDRLGLMYNTNTQDLIKDYYPFDEGNDDAYTPDFGGFLNRAKNNYSMDITSFVQGLMNGDEKYTLELAPAYGREFEYNSVLQLGGTVIKGGDINNSCEVVITYTLLK